MGKFVSTYTDSKTRGFEALIAEQAKDAMGDMEPLETPLTVFLHFTLPIPASASKKVKEALLNAPHTKKPDIDNLCKSVLDGMANIVFKNDGQIASLHATKKYGNVGFINVLVKEEND
jgi:Holliday junction resolvase RusA-like endonuclease